MGDSDTTREPVPTTTYLPDHLLAGGTGAIPTVRSLDDAVEDDAGEADETATDAGENATAEFCRSWRRHRSGSRSFPF